MKSKTVAIVAGVAAFSAAFAAVLVSHSRDATAVQEFSARIYPDLDSKAKDVASIVVNAGGVTSTVQKKGSAWVLAEKGGYPVKLDKVKEIVGGLSELKQLEPKTSKPDLYAKIGVEDPPAQPPAAPAPAAPADPTMPPPEASQATMVTLKDASGGTVASAIIGKQQMGARPAVFIRKSGEAQSWLAEGKIDLPRDASAWFDTQIANITRDRVKSASITPGRADGSPLVVSRQKKEDASFAVEALPEGRALKEPTSADGAANAMSYMTFDDVAQASTVAAPEGVTPTTYELHTFDGLVVVAKVFQKDGKYWVSFVESVDEAALPKAPDPAASAAPPAPVDPAKPADQAKPAEAPDPAKLAADAAKQAADEAAKKAGEVKKEVADFNSKHGGWVYAISEYRGKALVTKLEDLLAAPAPAAPAASSAGESPAPAPAPEPATEPSASPPAPEPTQPPAPEPAPAPEPK